MPKKNRERVYYNNNNNNNMTLLFTYQIIQYYKSLSYKMHLSEIKGVHAQLRAFARAPER